MCAFVLMLQGFVRRFEILAWELVWVVMLVKGQGGSMGVSNVMLVA